MRILRIVFLHVRSLFRSGSLDADVRAELQQHYDREIERLVAAGIPVNEARRRARLDIGSIDEVAEASRTARGLAWWDALRSDLRYAFRQIRKRPGFSAAAILTLAVGVGATAAVFAVVDSVLLRPLPYPSSERLYSLYEINARENVGRTRATVLNFMDWRTQATSFDGMAAHVGTGFTLTGRGDPEFTLGQVVTTNLLDVLRVQPLLGRNFQPHESVAGSHRVVLLTYGLWMAHFGGDRSVVNTITTINGEPWEIIGVLPRGFAYPDDTYRLLAPFVTSGTLRGAPPVNRSARYLRVVGRLKDMVSEDAARGEIAAIGARLTTEYPDANATVSIGMTKLIDDVVGGTRANLLVILVAVAFVLVIACVNVAGLSIARGNARGRELAIRTAIGASRSRLVRQLATEGLVLFAIGGAAGVAIAGWTVSALSATLPDTLPRAREIAIDGRFLLFGGLLTAVAGLVSSTLPALQVASRGPARDLASSRGAVSVSLSTHRMRAALIVVQVAAAVMLLTGAALALRSFQRVSTVEKGFDPASVMTFSFLMRDNRYPTAPAMNAFLSHAMDTLQMAPGVASVGSTTHLPLGDNNLENSFTVDGSTVAAGEDPPLAGVRGVAGQYVSAIGAHLLEGRDFQTSDTAASQPVVIVTEDFARRHVTNRPVIGARLKMGGSDSDDPWRTIVGVIGSIRHGGFDHDPRPEVWFPFGQLPEDLVTRWLRGANIVVRTTIDPVSTIPALRAAMRSLDPDLPLLRVQPMADLARSSTAERRLETSLLAAFASIALTLAAIGLFGVLAFYVSQHIQEFGVRLALGATPQGLLALVLRRGVVLLAIGLGLGLPGAAAVGRGMSTLLFGIEPLDPVAIALAVLVLTLVTLASCVLPARRAMKTDPLVALRTD
jgi:putative ABC transport system permease protein